MKKFLHTILNRMVITAFIVLLQIGFVILELVKWGNYYVEIAAVLRTLSLFVVLYIISKPYTPSVKLAWIVPILVFPLFGGVLYLAFGHVFMSRKLKRNIETTNAMMKDSLIESPEDTRELRIRFPQESNLSHYISTCAWCPVYTSTQTTYYNDALPYWEALKKDLESAEKYIFIESFIIGEGRMWGEILEILKRKVCEGVEVRVLYDDIGSIFYLPKRYFKELEGYGIKCIPFNRLVPFMAVILNNRDHRKIVVIDGKTGYTGGINLADEYVNFVEKFGYWKDAGLRMEGEAVWSLSVMFLEMWNIARETDKDYSVYKNEKATVEAGGFVQPFGDMPLDKELVGEDVYLNMIGNAQSYLYIFTPYLIPTQEIMKALCLAGKRGVDVRIVTPGVPDKKLAYYLTQSNYKILLDAGVKIYQYTPGFIHSKCVLCDDKSAVVGTVNFDYRSFYHHFECGVLLLGTSSLMSIRKDMDATFALSEEITVDWVKKNHTRIRVVGPVLKLFAPLL